MADTAGSGWGKMARQRGFTLIEMSLVIAILGLMVGGGIIAIGPILLQAKTNQTNVAMDQIESALVVFAIRNNRLPCPADGSFTSTANAAQYGLEQAPAAAGGPCTVAALANSVVPWRTLGLDETYSVDGWNNRISYFPANSMIAGVNTLVDNTGLNCLNRIASTTAPPQGFRSTTCDPANALTAGSYGTYNLPTFPFGNYIAVYVAANPYGAELTSANPGAAGTAVSSSTSPNYVGLYGQRAAYVLISHGTSGWYSWPRGGGAQRPTPNVVNYVVKTYNDTGSAGPGGSLGFVQGTPMPSSQQSSAGYFDDIVRWRSPAFVIQNCGSGACGNP